MGASKAGEEVAGVVPYAGADIWRSEVDVAGLAVAVSCAAHGPRRAPCANIRRRASRATHSGPCGQYECT